MNVPLKVLLTNDDGLYSHGLRSLWRELKEVSEVSVVVPEQPRSATGKSLTLHKPLRLNRTHVAGLGTAYIISGSPGDAIQMAFHKVLSWTPDVVASGINPGDNTTIDTLLTSGTVAAAIEASLLGVPSVAFSMKIPHDYFVRESEYVQLFDKAAKIAAGIVKWVGNKGLPDEVDLLNVNFPMVITKDTEIHVTRLARMKFENYVIERRDPQGKLYYWLGGTVTANIERGTDLYSLEVERAISITPIKLDMTAPIDKEYFNQMFSSLNIKGMIFEDENE